MCKHSLLGFLFVITVTCNSHAFADGDSTGDTFFTPPIAAVLKIKTLNGDATRSEGTGIAIKGTGGKVLTNCHVLAKAIVVQEGEVDVSEKKAMSVAISAKRDLCLLTFSRQDEEGIDVADALPTVGAPVYALSYSGGERNPRISKGVILALYNYDGGYVIQTSASFSMGASGGALVDENGRLVGILTFILAANNPQNNAYFAVPASWIKPLLEQSTQEIAPFDAKPFYHKKYLRPNFMKAVWNHTLEHWCDLLKVAEEWMREAPGDPNALSFYQEAKIHLKIE